MSDLTAAERLLLTGAQPPPLATVLVEPASYRQADGIVCGRLESVRLPTYPADDEARGHAVRMLRATAGPGPLGLREAARRLGVTATWLSEVEIGRRRLVCLDDAREAMVRAWAQRETDSVS